MAEPFTSGSWLVKEGSEEAFIEEWSAFTRWALDNAAGARYFVLVRSDDDPRAFVSLGEWDGKESVQAWRAMPEFAERLGRCRAHCDQFEPSDYTLASAVGR